MKSLSDTTPVTALRRRAGRLAILTAILTAAVFALVRRTQFFAERIELPLYDSLTTLTHPWKVGHPDVVLVTIRDHRAPFWPITDARLADTLTFLVEAGATCVGVDLKRDDYRADPVDPSGASRLYDLAANHDQVIWIRAMAGDGSFGPPPFLLDLRQRGLLGEEEFALRATLADYPADLGMVVRRGYLAAEEIWSLPAALANLHAVAKQPERAEEFGRRMGEIGGLRRDAGGYWIDPLPPEGIGDQFLLKFGPGMDAAFRDYPLEDLPGWDQETLREAFAGKVVLLGTHDSATAKDEAVVIGDENLRGVKLHALATAQLLRELTAGEPPVHHTAEWLEAVLTVAAALLAAAGVWLTRLPSLWKSAL
ncbi:MAG: CHASE2 domain-containing protein, partial [Akkermansiaceae bacterium]|nr:CHASE2 domain-containing protein [Akkermansiaceae bacterium]